ncbi:response regulator transcription factor [Microbacterium sp.]|uniref:response regulator transcription factor n=1 Tax=Microbacterium sp. TaxID=51671 RepID=UPI0028116549|nr:response regulator transcription factor [Microbacterium sp.]
MTRVFLVDDHEIVRRGIADLLDRQRDLEVVGDAGTVKQALARVAATNPDVVVLDVRLPDGDGIQLCRAIRSAHPDIACLMLTAYDDDDASTAAVLAGAAGYVLKDIRGPNLADAIRRVASGRSLVAPAVAQRVVASVTRTVGAGAGGDAAPDLTLRERQVLRLIGEGLTNRQIGEQLNLAEKTVKNYVSGLLAKLGMERRTQAAVYATSQGRA